MSDLDLFVQKLRNESQVIKKNLSSVEGDISHTYLQAKSETLDDIADKLKMTFNLDCRYLVVNKGRMLDNCKLKNYCDPRNCTYLDK